MSHPLGWVRRIGLVAAVLIAGLLAACSSPGAPEEKSYAIGTFLPTTGADAAIGQAMQDAVDLAVSQHALLGNGWTLKALHVDEDGSDAASAASSFVADGRVLGIVGPLSSEAAVGMVPVVAQNGLATISPGATLPGLTLGDQAGAEGLSAAQVRPKGKPVAFFRMPATDLAGGKAAADLALAGQDAHGLEAQSVFVVDDGSLSGKALAAAFAQELKAKGGSVAGQQSIAADGSDSVQAAVTAIIKAAPDAVFFAGGTTAGSALRGALSLTGAPQLPVLTVGTIADHPGWGKAVGVIAAASATTALVSAADLSALPNAKQFVSDFQAAYPDDAIMPQAALAYDAAMDEIAAIEGLVKSGKAAARADVLAAVASGKYAGVTGTVAFDQNGDMTPAPRFSVYTCDVKGAWKYATHIGG